MIFPPLSCSLCLMLLILSTPALLLVCPFPNTHRAHMYTYRHRTSHPIFSLVRVTPSYFCCDPCAIPHLLQGDLSEGRSCFWDSVTSHKVLWPLLLAEVFWFEHKGGNKSSLRDGARGWCLQLQSCRGRPGAGPVQAALRQSPAHAAISLSPVLQLRETSGAPAQAAAWASPGSQLLISWPQGLLNISGWKVPTPPLSLPLWGTGPGNCLRGGGRQSG